MIIDLARGIFVSLRFDDDKKQWWVYISRGKLRTKQGPYLFYRDAAETAGDLLLQYAPVHGDPWPSSSTSEPQKA